MAQNRSCLQEDVNSSMVPVTVSIAETGASVASEDAETDPDDSDEDAHRTDILASGPPGGNGTAGAGDPPPAFRTQEQESDSVLPEQKAPAFQTVDLQPEQQ